MDICVLVSAVKTVQQNATRRRLGSLRPKTDEGWPSSAPPPGTIKEVKYRETIQAKAGPHPLSGPSYVAGNPDEAILEDLLEGVRARRPPAFYVPWNIARRSWKVRGGIPLGGNALTTETAQDEEPDVKDTHGQVAAPGQTGGFRCGCCSRLGWRGRPEIGKHGNDGG